MSVSSRRAQVSFALGSALVACTSMLPTSGDDSKIVPAAHALDSSPAAQPSDPARVETAPATATESVSTDAARALFVALCASCHGETGDGRGTVVLDRPARSFRDGSFSFGNTPEALLRTITTGILGTTMPGFASALSAAELRAVADYVVTLGPPESPEAPDGLLQVVDRPLVVRGMLPAIGTDDLPVPRGLLIGLLDGTSFEYRADDLALRAIRFGDFVLRRDGSGRDGMALQPLGRLVCIPPATLGALEVTDDGLLPRGRPLVRQLASTWVRGGNAGLTYRLVDLERGRLADVEESSAVVVDGEWVTWTRQLLLKNVSTPWRLRIHAGFGPEREVRWQTDRLPEEEYGGAARHCVFEVADDRRAEMTILTAATCASFVQDAVDFEIPASWNSAFEVSLRIHGPSSLDTARSAQGSSR